jgi:hypothetical protein
MRWQNWWLVRWLVTELGGGKKRALQFVATNGEKFERVRKAHKFGRKVVQSKHYSNATQIGQKTSA